MKAKNKTTLEKLEIPADYQYRVLHSGIYFHSNWFNNKLVAIEHLAQFSKDIRVLDLGSGSGIFELKFAKGIKEIVAIDNYQPALNFLNQILKEKGIKNVKLIKRDLGKINEIKKPGQFEVIIMLDVIEHLNIKALKLILKVCRKLLKKHGIICITTPNYNSSWAILERIWDKVYSLSHLNDEQHITRFNQKNLRALFETNGYHTKNITTTNLVSFIIPPKRVSEKISLLELSMKPLIGNLLIGVFENSNS